MFEEGLVDPSVMAIAEYICGRGRTLSSRVLATVRTAGSSLGFSCTAIRATCRRRFPEHMRLVLTACWVTDEFTKANGVFMIIPGTQSRTAKPATTEEEVPGPAMARSRSSAHRNPVVLWDGAVWHGNYPRTEPGERVVLHVHLHPARRTSALSTTSAT